MSDPRPTHRAHSNQPGWRNYCLAVTLALVPGAGFDLSAPNATSQQALLRSQRDGAAVVRELRQLCRDLKGVDRLITDLDSPRYQRREQATQRLLQMHILPETALQQAVATGSAEVRYRASLVLRQNKTSAQQSLDALLGELRQYRVKGAAPEILELLVAFPDLKIQWGMIDALCTTVRPVDEELLRRHLPHDNAAIRLAAVSALGSLSNPEIADSLLPLTSDESETVRLAVAGALARFQRRESLDVLVDLLSSHDREMRTDAELMLQNITGQNFGFFTATDDQQRRTAIRAWQAWANDGNALRRRSSPHAHVVSPFD